MDISLFEFAAYSLGFTGELLGSLCFRNQDEEPFELLQKEFEQHIPTIKHVGMDFYKPEEAKMLLKHLANIVGYEGIYFTKAELKACTT